MRFRHTSKPPTSSYGYQLAQKRGKGTRRLIKFDEIERSIHLSYKVPSSDIWHTITPAMASKYRERGNERNLATFSGTLSPPSNAYGRRTNNVSMATGANLTAPAAVTPIPQSQIRTHIRWRPQPPPMGWGGSSSWN